MCGLLSKQLVKPATISVIENGVSFLEQVICLLLDVIDAVCLVHVFTSLPFFHFKNIVLYVKSLDLLQEADNNENGKAPHFAW